MPELKSPRRIPAELRKAAGNKRPSRPPGMPAASPEELLENLKRLENIISEVSKLFRK
jgi:hypothetical protein